MRPLRLLEAQGRAKIGPDFLAGHIRPDVQPFLSPFRRALDLTPLVNIVARANRKYEAGPPEASDAWLAPRVHATLRLTRSEASDRRIWDYLAVVELPDYIRWRFQAAPADRFLGPDYKHALARLWWGAELTRNGPDYSPTVSAFKLQDIPNTWQRFDAFHNRPAALAAVRFLSTANGGGPATSDEVNRLGRAFNSALTTTALDALAPNPQPDMDAIRRWIAASPDETLMDPAMPLGPEEAAVPEDAINAVEELLRRLWSASHADLLNN